MMRNEGLSRKTSYPINIISDDGKVRVLGSAGVAYSGNLFWQGGLLGFERSHERDR